MTSPLDSMQKSSEQTTELATSSWWVWISWLERGETPGFVYGCAALCFRAPGRNNRSELEIPGAGRLIICQQTVTKDSFHVFRDALNAGSVKPEILLGIKAPEAQVAETRDLIQGGLGHTAARVAVFYTLPDLPCLIGHVEGGLEGILSALQEQLNLPFKSSYAARLGNFEIFDLNPWLDRAQPFLIEAVGGPGHERIGPETLEICRTPDFARERHLAHVVGRVCGDVVLDRMVTLEPGRLRVAIVSAEWLDQLDFWVFSGTGDKLLHTEHSTFLTRIGLVLSPMGRQMIIEDDISRRAAQQGDALGARAATVRARSSQRSEIGTPPKGSWRRFAEEMKDAVAAALPVPSEDRWFTRGIEGEVGAIAHLNHLLYGGCMHRAVLVDPWFGTDALKRFALRLESQDIHLTIVTSWINIDPDTGLALDLATSPTAKLEATVRQIQPFLNPRFALINLADGSRQAFHDRYLLIYPHEGPTKAFLLSNSLNKMAGDWPFSMSLLAADIGREVRRYIEGLCAGQDVARGKPLTITFKWPVDG